MEGRGRGEVTKKREQGEEHSNKRVFWKTLLVSYLDKFWLAMRMISRHIPGISTLKK